MLGIGKRIRALREARGMTQLGLALAAEISPTYLSDLENERRGRDNPTIAVLIRIADALDVSLDVLVGREHKVDQDWMAADRIGEVIRSNPEAILDAIEDAVRDALKRQGES